MSDQLGGEMDPSAWYFSRLGETGPLPNPVGHTFPLLTHSDDGKWSLVGTGFYINDGGLFVTARHVIEEVLTNGRQVSPLIILHLHSESGMFGPTEFQLRPIRQCWLSDRADVALGVAATPISKATGQTMKNWTWTLSWSVPANGAPCSTYAFPNHMIVDAGRRIRFAPDAYDGHVQDSGDFRDRVMMPFPYLVVDFRIHGAASGGPILVNGMVAGINCTELPKNIDHPPGPGFGVQSRCLADAFLNDVVLPNETTARCVTFDELVHSGCINVAGYESQNRKQLLQGTLVKLDFPATATPPAIEIGIYC